MKDGGLFVRLMEEWGTWDAKLYLLGGNEFGIKRYSLVLRFDDGSLTFHGHTCKKLQTAVRQIEMIWRLWQRYLYSKGLRGRTARPLLSLMYLPKERSLPAVCPAPASNNLIRIR